jgi:hypothetical protein
MRRRSVRRLMRRRRVRRLMRRWCVAEGRRRSVEVRFASVVRSVSDVWRRRSAVERRLWWWWIVLFVSLVVVRTVIRVAEWIIHFLRSGRV